MSSAYYRKMLRDREKELSNYKKRKNALQGILNSYRAFDADASDLNRYCRNAADGMRYGIKTSGGGVDPDRLWGSIDRGTGDGNVSESRNYVNAEMLRVDRKIQELNAEIERLRALIRREEQREREEAERRRNKQ